MGQVELGSESAAAKPKATKTSAVALPPKIEQALGHTCSDAAAVIEAHCLPSVHLRLKDASDRSIPVGKTARTTSSRAKTALAGAISRVCEDSGSGIGEDWW
jgi:hypothetical protein